MYNKNIFVVVEVDRFYRLLTTLYKKKIIMSINNQQFFVNCKTIFTNYEWNVVEKQPVLAKACIRVKYKIGCLVEVDLTQLNHVLVVDARTRGIPKQRQVRCSLRLVVHTPSPKGSR